MLAAEFWGGYSPATNSPVALRFTNFRAFANAIPDADNDRKERKDMTTKNAALLAMSLVWLGFQQPAAYAAIHVGGNFGGADLTLADGDILVGTFTNVGSFTIPSTASVFVQQGTALSVQADQVLIAGILDGSGAGFLGGSNGFNGLPGLGPGGGEGGLFGSSVHASGGGGGGHGGAGGNSGQSLNSPPFAAGGPSNGSASGTSAGLGSGGGGAGDHSSSFNNFGGSGGNGGGSISLFANDLTLLGAISVSGENGNQGTHAGNTSFSVSGGGGGAGGSIVLSGSLQLDGLLDASGGNGADALLGPTQGGAPYWGQGGGGGGGGRIKLLGEALFGTSFVFDVNGGELGTSDVRNLIPATSGFGGTFFDNTSPLTQAVPEPTMLLVWSGLAGCCVAVRKKR